VQTIIDHTTRAGRHDRHNQRPAWDSSWRPEAVRQAEDNLEQASGWVSDFAGVGVCGVKPFNISKDRAQGGPALADVAFRTCGGLSDIATSIQPIAEPEESKSVLRRLLEAQMGRADGVGLIKRFEPTGAKLYVTDKERAMSVSWLTGASLLRGRAVRCLRVDAADTYPAMRALHLEVDDTMSEPILGYFCPVDGGPYAIELADKRRGEVKQVLDFMHEGIRAGENILVHCRLGTNRSVMIALAYLMIYHRMRAQDAIELIQRRGPSRLVVRQPGFTQQLLCLERELLQRRASVDVGDWRDLALGWSNLSFGSREEDLSGLSEECTFLQDKLASQAGVIHRVLASAAAHQPAPPGSQGFPAPPFHVLSPPNTPGKQLTAAAAARAHDKAGGGGGGDRGGDRGGGVGLLPRSLHVDGMWTEADMRQPFRGSVLGTDPDMDVGPQGAALPGAHHLPPHTHGANVPSRAYCATLPPDAAVLRSSAMEDAEASARNGGGLGEVLRSAGQRRPAFLLTEEGQGGGGGGGGRWAGVGGVCVRCGGGVAEPDLELESSGAGAAG
jgi:predicted protein tyrosine phosphatase